MEFRVELVLFSWLLTYFAINCQILDEPRGPWRLVFKAVQGNTNYGSFTDFWKLYDSTESLNENSVSAQTNFGTDSEPFKSLLLEDWAASKLNVQAVKLSLFKDGVEEQYIVFDAKGKTKEDWFACSNILYSSYTDVNSSLPEHACLLKGTVQRPLTIQDKALGEIPCDQVSGWLITVENNYVYHECRTTWLPIEPSFGKPYFLYAPGNTKTVFDSSRKHADSLAIFVQAWDMVFRGVSGIDGFFYNLWLSDQVKNDDDPDIQYLTEDSTKTFKSSLVNSWEAYNIDMVKYSMFKGGVESAYVVFSGMNTDKSTWFADDKILMSSYADIKENKAVCSILGDGIRRWEIQKVSSETCKENEFWMAVLDDTNATSTPCSWDDISTLTKPYFLYSVESMAVPGQTGSNRNPDLDDAEVMGIFVHGWRLVFKVASGGSMAPASSLYNLWTNTHTVNEDATDVNTLAAGTSLFKSSIIDNWSQYYIRAVKVAMFANGTEQQYITFDATGSDKNSWFAQERILYSSFTDLETASFTDFSIEGTTNKGLPFSVLSNNDNCNGATGWMTVVDDSTVSHSCDWETGSLPQFLYADGQLLSLTESKTADVFAIFIDMDPCTADVCKNNATCEELGSAPKCHCVDDYFGDTCSNRDGNFSEWSDWSACPVTCAGANQTRTRACDDPAPVGSGVCYGDSEERKECNSEPCPIDGGFSEWSEWDNCTKECGNGTHTRTRECNNPEPEYGGKNCTGPSTDVDSCNEHHCPINGNWSEWGNWSECSVTCSGGIQFKLRACDNPEPQYGGLDCEGINSMSRSCNNETCPPVHGNWSEWSEWGTCSVPCGSGGGNQTRTRTCTNPAPEWGGDNCTGEDEQIQGCNDYICPIHGGWSSWNEFSECVIPIGTDCGGTKTRNRTCDNPVPQFNGSDCIGDDIDTVPCRVCSGGYRNDVDACKLILQLLGIILIAGALQGNQQFV